MQKEFLKSIKQIEREMFVEDTNREYEELMQKIKEKEDLQPKATDVSVNSSV